MERVNVTQQFADRLELSWKHVKGKNISYILRYSSKDETTIAALEKGSVMTHMVSSLSPGTRYSFTLYTVFEGVRSRGLTFSSVTGLFGVSLFWENMVPKKMSFMHLLTSRKQISSRKLAS